MSLYGEDTREPLASGPVTGVAVAEAGYLYACA